MRRLVLTPEAYEALKANGLCIVELPHEEVSVDEQYQVGLGDEDLVVHVASTQKPSAGPRSHIQLAVLLDIKLHVG